MSKVNSIDLYSRQSLIFNSSDFFKLVQIYGCGFVGSNIAYTLAKTGFKNFLLIDPDIIKEHNLLNQCFRPNDSGKSKVVGLKNYILDNIGSYINTNIITKESTYEESKVKPGNNQLIIISTDNLESRINILTDIINNFNKCKNSIFLFANTSGDVFYTGICYNDLEFLIRMRDTYKSLTKEQTSEGLCGEKSTYYLGNFISGLLVSELRKILSNPTLSSYTQEYAFLVKDSSFISNFKWFKK